jgi:hypothetical protein
MSDIKTRATDKDIDEFLQGIEPVGMKGSVKVMRGWFKTVVRTATCTLPE